MFRREHHRRVAALLAALDADLLAAHACRFAGGTRIALELDEFRESADVDFLCDVPSSFAALRTRARAAGCTSLFSGASEHGLSFPREASSDQYGLRFPVAIEGVTVRFEVVFEARIELDAAVGVPWAPVPCLPLVDCYAEKLLANSDRWPDRQVLSRDLIDLAALRALRGEVPAAAWEKVDRAYGVAPRADLRKALAALGADDAYTRRCFAGLGIEDPRPVERGLELLDEDVARAGGGS